MANTKALISVHTSPAENLNASSVAILPFDKSTTTPAMQNNKPAMRNGVMRSFKKIADKMMANTGDEVVPIKARLIADVVCPAI